jgi:RNA polymerase sigma-70 factor (ECF subfamily)
MKSQDAGAIDMNPSNERPQEDLEPRSAIDENLRCLLGTHFESGFCMLMIAYTDKLLGYVSARFHQCDAHEIVQVVWIKAWETLRTYEVAKLRTLKLSSWLYTTAHNYAVNVLKHNSLLKDVFSLDTPEGKACVESHPHGQTPLLEDEILHKEQLEELSLCVSQLPGMYYTVITLHYHAGLPYPEIAQILNKPLNTVKSAGLRAVRLLRLKMEHINMDEE